MHNYLVPFDGSNFARAALEYALARATEVPAKLHLVTVLEEAVVYGEIEVYVSRGEMEALQRKHGAEILQPAREAVEKAGVPFTSEVLIGEIAPSIAKRASELNCDGIIMGTRGMSEIGNLVLGSVAVKVVHLAAVPVTLVKGAA
jgi:nucleotide-binding universal stress UspA family protein